MIHSLQIYRGIAAMLVVLYHLRGKMTQYFEGTAYSDFWKFGSAGVYFFFVLSGYIIFTAHRGEALDRQALLLYLRKRINRIYPPYWIVNALLFPFWFFVAAFAHDAYGTSIGSYLLSFFLIPQEHGTYLAVGWTLVFEGLFYLVFCLHFLTRYFLQTLVLWGGAIVANWTLAGDGPWLLSFVLSPLNLLFLSGVFLARYPLPGLGWSQLSLVLGALGFSLPGIWMAAGGVPGPWIDAWFGLSSVLLVASARGPLEGFFAKRKFLLLLGAASYSIYLVHFPILSLASKILSMLRSSIDLPTWCIWTLLLVLATSAGIVFHLVVEKPLIRWGAKLLRLRSSKRNLVESTNAT